MRSTHPADLQVFTATDAGEPVGAIIFSRLAYAQVARAVFVLGPVAVAPDHQGKGIDPRLIAHGLDALRQAGVDIAATYGDRAFR